MARIGPVKRLGRHVYSTLTIVAAVAIASGCYTTRWVPVTQAPPQGVDPVLLRVYAPPDSASRTARLVTLYHARMEGDSVLMGRLAPYDTAASRLARVQAASTFVQVTHFDVYRTLGAVGAICLVAGLIANFTLPFGSH